jgi:hypothetical protein
MSKKELKGTNQSLMETTLNGTKRDLKVIILTKVEINIKRVTHMKDTRAQLLEHLPGSLTKEETLAIKEPFHLSLPQVAPKLKISRSQL